MSQFDDGEPDERELQEYRKTRAQSTSSLCGAIAALRSQNFHDKYLGSGFNISITKLDGNPLLREFMIPGEALEVIKAPIIEALIDQLKFRQMFLKQEMSDIDKALNT